MAGDYLDLSSESPSGPPRKAEPAARRFLGVEFACCGVYARIYLNGDQSAFVGHCPRCSKPVRIRVGPGGSTSRFFTVS